MARVYAVASAKGGVGKTTLTANLGVAFAAAGLDVVVVDADVGMPNLGRRLGVSPDGPTLHDVLAGEAAPLDAVYDGPEGVAVLPGDPTLDAYAAVDPRELRQVVDALTAYDLVLVDTGAGLSHDAVLPLGLADSVLLVSTPSPDAVGDTAKTRQLAARLDVPVAGLVVTRVDPDADADVDALGATVDAPVLGVVPEDPLDADSTGGLAVTRDPDSAVAVAYRTLADAIVPAADVDFDLARGDEVEADPESTADEQDQDAPSGDVTDDSVTTADADEDDETVEDDETGEDDTESTHAAEAPTENDSETDGAGAAENDAEPTASIASTAENDTDAADTADGGLASMLAAAESSVDSASDETAADSLDAVDSTDEDEGTETVESVTDVVVEAEPDRERGTPPDPSEAETGVTIEPAERADIPDAEAQGTDDTDSDEDDADEKKGGLFGRFFG